MENKVVLKKKLFEKLVQVKPHMAIARVNELVERLADADERLQINISEWLEDRELTDIWIHDKYCIGAVLKIRDDGDFVSALLALDDYAKDVSNEAFLWQARK